MDHACISATSSLRSLIALLSSRQRSSSLKNPSHCCDGDSKSFNRRFVELERGRSQHLNEDRQKPRRVSHEIRNLSSLSPPNSSSPTAPVLSKNILLNPTHKTWIRIFRPQNPSTSTSLPIIIYFHAAGGFILFSAASQPFHASCEHFAREMPAIIVSVEYRLAPEHHLPAAYEDAADAIRWVSVDSRRDPWFDSADRSRCFLMGSSAGGNIAYHSALRAVASGGGDLQIAGVILSQPYFGGEVRSGSELRLVRDRMLPLPANDLMSSLSLPDGADRDHEFSNQMVGGEYEDRVGQLPRCLMAGHEQDPLVDRQRELMRMLEGRGVQVVSHFDEDGFHGVELFDPRKLQELTSWVRNFVSPHEVTSQLTCIS